MMEAGSTFLSGLWVSLLRQSGYGGRIRVIRGQKDFSKKAGHVFVLQITTKSCVSPKEDAAPNRKGKNVFWLKTPRK
jgi:hypothetical protein